MTSETRGEHLEDKHDPTENRWIVRTDNELIATCIREARAREIVRALNSHDDLVAALEGLVSHLAVAEHKLGGYGPNLAGRMERARAALARARGED